MESYIQCMVRESLENNADKPTDWLLKWRYGRFGTAVIRLKTGMVKIYKIVGFR